MLTQRIGKSANEFLTMEGVSPEAVFLLGKDLNSFREIAEGLLSGWQAGTAPAGTKDRRPRSACSALLEAVRGDPHAGQRHSGQPAGPGVRARGAGRDHCRQRAAAHRPGRRAGALSAADRLRQPAACCLLLAFAILIAGGGVGLCACSCVTRPSAAQPAASSAWKPSARSRKPSASTTPTRRPFCA